MKIVISSGHGKYVRGASGFIDEVDEARKVVNRVVQEFETRGIEAIPYHDDVSQSQNENLDRIVDFHNSKTRDLDISVHFNATDPPPSGPVGCEVLYASDTGMEIADEVVDAICEVSGLKNRGPKYRDNLAFLNGTEEPAILVEVCFVDSEADCEIYHENFDVICAAIAAAVSGEEAPVEPDRPDRPEPPDDDVLFSAEGSCSHFGGPEDTGVSASEGLAFIYDIDEAPHLFLPEQPDGTSGLARRLNPYVHYIACRWDYSKTSKDYLKSGVEAWVYAPSTGIGMRAFPADWGPHEDTDRVADLSPGLMRDLRITTDAEVQVILPYTDEAEE